MQQFDHIVWQDNSRFKACFSKVNPAHQASVNVKGLDLGYNTIEKDEITQRNREEWIRCCGAKVEHASWGIQVHGNRVQQVDTPGIFPATDAMVTNKPGIALAVFVADCAGVLLADPDAGVIATAHAGWKGAAADIVNETIREMEKLGANPARMKAFVSPCISFENFEVGEEVAVQFPEEVVDRSYLKPHINLKEFVRMQLLAAGLPEGEISVHPDCTFVNEDYFSYRRQKEKSGRMMGIIFLKSV
ncbi:MAG: peptidoglycan editing factor PgeF [Balneolales bacterium]|nr:peptidoglycan editing factor PgeF [Balneolales bacterium]